VSDLFMMYLSRRRMAPQEDSHRSSIEFLPTPWREGSVELSVTARRKSTYKIVVAVPTKNKLAFSVPFEPVG